MSKTCCSYHSLLCLSCNYEVNITIGSCIVQGSSYSTPEHTLLKLDHTSEDVSHQDQRDPPCDTSSRTSSTGSMAEVLSLTYLRKKFILKPR